MCSGASREAGRACVPHEPTKRGIELEGTEAEDIAPRAHRRPRRIMPKRRRLTRHRDQNVCKPCTLNAQSPRSSDHCRRAARHTQVNTRKRPGVTAHTSAQRRKLPRPNGRTTAQTAKSSRRTEHTTALTSNSHVRPVHTTAPTAKSRGPTAHSTGQTAKSVNVAGETTAHTPKTVAFDRRHRNDWRRNLPDQVRKRISPLWPQ